MASALRSKHNGGKLRVGPDKNIGLTISDIFGRITRAQNVKNGSSQDYLSGILRFTSDGGSVGGSPLGITPLE